MFRPILVALLSSNIACAYHNAPSSIRLDSAFTLAPGEQAVVDGGGLHVEFRLVLSDSRCPADVMCVQAGNATLEMNVQVGGGSTDTVHLSTTLGKNITTLSSYRLELVRLEPYPYSSSRIDPATYRATLRVTH
jgi:hypothetical protein